MHATVRPVLLCLAPAPGARYEDEILGSPVIIFSQSHPARASLVTGDDDDLRRSHVVKGEPAGARKTTERAYPFVMRMRAPFALGYHHTPHYSLLTHTTSG